MKVLKMFAYAVLGSLLAAVGGALAQKFAKEGFFTVLTTRTASNAAALEAAIKQQGNACMTVELDLSSEKSIASAFATIRAEATAGRGVERLSVTQKALDGVLSVCASVARHRRNHT